MRRAFLTCAFLLAIVPALRADERYYVVLFASQNSTNDARLSHTFATFVKIDRQDDPKQRAQRETAQSVTISWLSAGGSVRILERPVTGRNYTLQESLTWAEERGLTTTMRGPFEIGKDVFDRAVKQKERLESGAILYKAVDRRFRPEVAINCVHAVSDVLPGPLLMTGSARGDAATAMVANHYRPYFVDPERTHVAVLRHLGLNGNVALVRDGNGRRSTANGTSE